MSFLSSLDISGSGLNSQRIRMNTIAENIANVNSAISDDGETYARKMVVMGEKVNNFSSLLKGKSTGGVEIKRIVEDTDAFKMVYEPSNPYADENGYIRYPNINMLEEMMDLMEASRSYQANITAANATKAMASAALQIGK